MTSIILYGRNDNHGYNYHKRLAISLNCIAEVLSDPHDEILFADDNTPNDFPTIIEAIQDTLTEKAQQKIRILRIRPRHHPIKTDLPVQEALARNVAIRRSNPLNRWILSTNSDMIFVPTENRDLTTLISSLSDGFYLLPRFSLPEALWELSLDRTQPRTTLEFLKNQHLHLHTVVRRPGFLKYDNPGDFQLMLRKDIFEIEGFDETMTRGWHVDSNLCKRMDLLGRKGNSIEHLLQAYHCNHNQKETLFHQKVAENNWSKFVTNLSSYKTFNHNWGLPEEEIEEIKLKNHHLNALNTVLNSRPKREYELNISFETFNTKSYFPERILAPLADHFCHLPKDIEIAYIGVNPEMVELIQKYLQQRRFTKPLQTTNLNRPYLTICDFGVVNNDPQQLQKVVKLFLKMVKKRASSRFIGIHLLHTDYNAIFSRHLLIRNSGHSTGVSYGILPLKRKPQKLIYSIHYWVVRFFPAQADRLRKFLAKSKLTQTLFKKVL